jgi:alpha-amylase/alpha-mannosidase (GH57 family)
MKYIAIYHANLNYAYLTPDKYEFVIRNAYEVILDTMAGSFPDVRFVFEASGYTINEIAARTPDVLNKLKSAIDQGRCEFMGSPYAHPMLPNFPEIDGKWSIKFSNDCYKKVLGIEPKSFWNPECGWRSFVPHQVKDNGYQYMIGDFEAYSRSVKDGNPIRPEIYEKEFTNEAMFYNMGFKYDLSGSEKAIHFPFEHKDSKLKIFLRTDRVAQFGVRFFMGMEGYTLEKYLDLIKKYSEQKNNEPKGALIIFADDAEYIGTNGWFRLKYQNKPDNVFEATPQSKENLFKLISETKKLGEFVTFEEGCSLPVNTGEIYFDNDSAWHGAKASTWSGTPMAQLLKPWQDLVREKLNSISSQLSDNEINSIWFHLTNSYNSDGQWPPTLPTAPHIIHPFNYGYCFENLLKAELLVGGIDRSKLSVDPVETMNVILSLQGELILEKASNIISNGSAEEKNKANKAKSLIEKSCDFNSIRKNNEKILYPSEYTIRAEMLVEARRLVGGVEIEKTN